MKRTNEFLAAVSEIPNITAFAERIMIHWHLDRNTAYDVLLAIDEACTNLSTHAKTASGEPIMIILKMRKCFGFLCIRIVDNSIYYDIENAPSPDIQKNLSGEKKGGFGIFLIKTLMDRVKYKRTNNGNVLTMVKKIR